MALTGMILGFASLFIDQYDLNFSPEGIAQEVVDVTRNFEIAVKPITTTLKTVNNLKIGHFRSLFVFIFVFSLLNSKACSTYIKHCQ